MPFTPTHTLAAVPLGALWRQPTVFSSLVIGSMVPDWPLYVPLGPNYDLTHSFPGLILACLPLGFAIAVIYRFALVRPLFELLPSYFQQRLVEYLPGHGRLLPRDALRIAAAIVLGAASHIIWDAFTHRGAWGVQVFPGLNVVVAEIGPARFTIYSALQHGSTLVGIPIFLAALVVWCRGKTVQVVPPSILPSRAKLIWVMILIGIPAIFFAKVLWNLQYAGSVRSVFVVLYYGVTQAGALLMIATLFLGMHHLVLLRMKK